MTEATGSRVVFDGSEPHLAGISPTFWAHVPLLISQINNNLKLINGINCLSIYTICESNNDISLTSSREFQKQEQHQPKLIPISKCRLIGTIIAVERKPANGSVIYVIDDGTGTIDVFSWIERDDLSDMLLSDSRRATDALFLFDENITYDVLQVGELVQVLGRIQVCAILPDSNAVQQCEGSNEERTSCMNCVREIHASRVEPVSFNLESRHWFDCARSSYLHNANDVLEKLGPAMTSQVAKRINLPAIDDTIGAWRLFGTNCTCDGSGVTYKEALLYCHCIATLEPLDPELFYRDTLLAHFLNMEEENHKATNQVHNHLRFQYKTIFNNELLREKAAMVVALSQSFPSVKEKNNFPRSENQICLDMSSSTALSPLQQRLIVNTFRALRQDGILYLLDSQSDTYILLSRTGILEPYFKVLLSKDADQVSDREFLKLNRPDYLAEVPKARLELVRRMLLAKSSREYDSTG